MNRSDLIDIIAANTGANKKQSGEALNALVDAIGLSLINGETVDIYRLGRLSTRRTKDRIGRNPRTGEEAPIPAKTKVIFKSAKALNDRVNG